MAAYDVVDEAVPQTRQHVGLLLGGGGLLVHELELDAVDAHALDLGQRRGRHELRVRGHDADLRGGDGAVAGLGRVVRYGVVREQGHAQVREWVRGGSFEGGGAGEDHVVHGLGGGLGGGGLGCARGEGLHEAHGAGRGVWAV